MHLHASDSTILFLFKFKEAPSKGNFKAISLLPDGTRSFRKVRSESKEFNNGGEPGQIGKWNLVSRSSRSRLSNTEEVDQTDVIVATRAVVAFPQNGVFCELLTRDI